MLRLIGIIAALPILYIAAALAGALIPRNPGWQEPARGVEIFVVSNGVHADLVLPARAGGMDLYRLLPATDIRRPQMADGWIAIGWGQREFYLLTPHWADLKPGVAARALVGGRALIHAVHMGRPVASRSDRPLRLSPGAYRRLVGAIAADLVRDRDGRARLLPGRGYGADDAFYEARGTYHAFATSNQWTADKLALAGVRIGVWTPFAQGFMWRFRDNAD